MSQRIADSSVVAAKDAHVSETVDGTRIVLNMETGTYYSLEGIGGEIWQEIQNPIVVEALQESITERYDVDTEECQADVLSFITALWEADLIEIRNNEQT